MEYALKRKSKGLARCLIKVGAGGTVLKDATERGDGRKIKYLVDLELNVNTKINRERSYYSRYRCNTALELAVEQENEEIIKLLIKAGADGGTAMVRASNCGNEKMLRFLLNLGVDADARGEIGQTALLEAAKEGNEKVVQLLIDNGADVNAKGGWDDSTALMEIVRSCCDSDKKERMVKLLIGLGVDVNAKDKSGRTPLMEAAKKGDKKVVQLLIDNDAEVNAKDESGRTSLACAVEGRNERIVRLLLDVGADVRLYDGLLARSLIDGEEGIVRLLINAGVYVGGRDLRQARFRARGETLRLIEAAFRGQSDVAI